MKIRMRNHKEVKKIKEQKKEPIKPSHPVEILDWLNIDQPIHNVDDDIFYKPCNKLGWCPYGQIVEMFPLKEVLDESSCNIFGHDCPVYYHAEKLQEKNKTNTVDDDEDFFKPNNSLENVFSEDFKEDIEGIDDIHHRIDKMFKEKKDYV